MSDHDGKVARPNFGDPKMTLDHRERFCGHEYVLLRQYSRTVVCRVCGAKVDPFEVLQDMARVWERVTYHQAELDKLRAETEELKREEQLTKARIRNARKQTEQAGQTEVFFAELLRRINEATTWGQLHDANTWAASFNWLTPEQNKALRDAGFAAKQRAEASARHAPRKSGRAVRVIKGGAT